MISRRQALTFLRRITVPTRRSASYRSWRMLGNIWNERLTRQGRFVVAASTLTGIAGSLPEFMVGSFAFSIFTALITISLFISYLRRPQVTVSRTLAERCGAGATITLRMTVENPTGKDLLDVGAYEYRLPDELELVGEPQYIASLAAGEKQTLDYSLRANRRGVYHLPGPTALSAFPFGLSHGKRFYGAAQRLVVYPSFHMLRRMDFSAGRRYQPGGVPLTSQIGDSMEFMGNREYRPGDRIRDLHIRSWARVGYPVVKQFQEEFISRVAMIVDTYVPRKESAQVLEGNLSLAAAVAEYLARQESMIDLFAAGPQLYHFQAGRSLAYVDNILDILACIEKCPDDPFAVIGPRFQEELQQISTVVALLLSWDEQRQEFVQRIRACGVNLRVFVLGSNLDRADLRAAAGSERVLSLEQVLRGVEEL